MSRHKKDLLGILRSKGPFLYRELGWGKNKAEN